MNQNTSLTAEVLRPIYGDSVQHRTPTEYQGVIIDNRSLNVHGSIAEFAGKSYLFYHVAGPSHWERRVCVAPLTYNEDGTIVPIDIAPSE